jgi:hypothetical protein
LDVIYFIGWEVLHSVVPPMCQSGAKRHTYCFPVAEHPTLGRWWRQKPRQEVNEILIGECRLGYGSKRWGMCTELAECLPMAPAH